MRQMDYASHCVFALTVCGNMEQRLFFLINISKRYHLNDNSECQECQAALRLAELFLSVLNIILILTLINCHSFLCSPAALSGNSEGMKETDNSLFWGNHTDQSVSLDNPPSEINHNNDLF